MAPNDDYRPVAVQVVYALPDAQTRIDITVARGTTVRQAIAQSGILQHFPNIDLATVKVGIFGKIVSMETLLRDRDRVEVYRPLIADPKAARRRRARK